MNTSYDAATLADCASEKNSKFTGGVRGITLMPSTTQGSVASEGVGARENMGVGRRDRAVGVGRSDWRVPLVHVSSAARNGNSNSSLSL